MLSRERLWQRVCAADLWVLPWAMAAASALPWLVSERWDGHLAFPWFLGGWLFTAGSLCLIRFPRWRCIPVVLVLAWTTFLSLRHLAVWESALPKGFQDIQGTISSPWRIHGDRRQGRLTIVEPAALAGCVLPVSLPLEGTPAPQPGSPVRFRGDLLPVDPAPRFIADRPLWRARNDKTPRRIFLRSAQVMEVLGPVTPSPLLRLQSFAQRRFEALALPPGIARDLWGALTLGIPPARDEVFSAFAESGTIHTMVVSGLQVTLMIVVMEYLWRHLLGRGSSLASVGGGLLYCTVVGFSAPVWRGLFMGSAWVLGRSGGWKLPPVAMLHGALLLWLLFHPAAGCEPGFLLAWWALLGVMWAAEPLAGFLSPWVGRWALPSGRFIAPWLTTLPLLALFHGGAPLWGVAANVVILPLITLLTPVCLMLTLAPMPGLVPLIGGLLAWMGERMVPWFARIVPLGTGILWPWLLLLLGWLWLCHRHAVLRRTRALILGLVGGSAGLLMFRGTGWSPDTLSVEAVDVGQGDALILRVPGGEAMVVDTGPSPWAARRLARVLSRRGVREPVHLAITHPHGDHTGGWAVLSRLWPFESVRIPASSLPPEAWSTLVPPELVDAAHTCLRGETWTLGDAVCSVRWPPKPFILDDLNMVSMVLRIRWQDREVWLMGDALDTQERDLLALGDPGDGAWRRLLKPGHHGGRSASGPQWLDALRPELAVITAGRRNTFEFPHRETLVNLEAAGCRSIQIVGPGFGSRLAATGVGWSTEAGSGIRASVP